jgi:RNA polymerase sigma-70 factor (ECF subfamily)
MTNPMPPDHDEFVRTLLAERGTLLGYIHALVRDRHLAEDVFQSVMVAAISKRDAIQDRQHLLKWLRTAARFEALSQLRKTGDQPPGLDDSVLNQLESHWARHDAHAGSVKADALRHCVNRLAPHARDLLRLRYDEGFSGERLAALVGKSLNTVYVTLTRIHRTLADCVRAQLQREGVRLG